MTTVPTAALTKTGAPGRDRTYNQRIRNPVLYPIELQAHYKLKIQPNNLRILINPAASGVALAKTDTLSN